MAAEKILVVDDDETILDVVEENLNQHGFQPTRANSGEAALNSIAQDKPDAIILDWQMPGIDGNEVLKRLQADENTKQIPVMMLTAKSEVSDVSESLMLGAKDYIVKPFDHDNLIVRLRNILRKAQ